MFKNNLAIILMFSSVICFSQEVVNSTPITLLKDRDVFQIVNEAKKETTLFISDKLKVKAICLNEKMQITDSISAERPDHNKYTDMIGYNGDSKNPRLFWSSSNRKDIYTQMYDFNNHKVTTQFYFMPYKEERFLQKFSQNDKFYILTILKNSNTLKLYVFYKDGKLEEKIIDLTGFRFYKSDYQKTTMYGVLSEDFFSTEIPFALQKINSEYPTSLVQSSAKKKCYLNSESLVLTIDTNIDQTQLITIDLKTFTAKEKFVKTEYLPYAERSSVKSNSFLIDDKLFQIKSTNSQMILTVKDLDDNLIKSYAASDKTPIINFKNTDIIQENSDSSKKRILETSGQFIRKINNLNAGISCYKLNENYIVTIGSVSVEEQKVSSAMIIGGMFGAVGAIAGSLIDAAISNPTMESFNSYANRKVVYINCLFDKEANHINGEIQPLAFDKIRIFGDNNKDISSQTLFKIDNIYYLGFYETKKYTIRKFED